VGYRRGGHRVLVGSWCGRWIDHLVHHANHRLQAGPARWVRLAVGLTSDEYQLSNAEVEAIQRVRGGIRPDRDSYLVTWIAQVDQRPRAELLRDGVQAWSGSGTSPGKPATQGIRTGSKVRQWAPRSER
jgi:hypothetical protein